MWFWLKRPFIGAACLYLLVEISWSSESAGTVSDAGLTAADWDAVVLGFFKPASVPPVRVVVDAATVKLTEEERRLVRLNLQGLEFRVQFASQPKYPSNKITNTRKI